MQINDIRSVFRTGWKHLPQSRLLAIALISALLLMALLPLACVADEPAATSAPATAAAINNGEHVFAWQPPGAQPKSVHVAGDFNGWSSVATPMTREADGIYRARAKLAEGVHHYKFVIDGSQWLNDPASDRELEVPDNYGGKNSAVLVGPDLRKAPPPKPNHINGEFVIHNPRDLADADNVGDGRLRVRLRTQAKDVAGVGVIVGDGTSQGEAQSLAKLGSQGGFDIFGGVVGAIGGQTPPAYFFALEDQGEDIYFGANGVVELSETSQVQEFAVPSPRIMTPDWAKHAVWYQIFPERFRNGDSSNDPGDQEFETLVPWTSNWWDSLPGEAAGAENFYGGRGNVWRRRYGGDIQGVREALPYLRKLGINAIYFNPIFEAESMHKYDTADFRHVDDNFGVKGDLASLQGETDDPATWQWTASDKIFLEFVAEAHRQGFKVIVDGVFNHVGRAHPFFMDVLEKGSDSKYASWFEITDWGDPANWRTMEKPFEIHGKPGGIQWRAWDGDSGHLPVFRKDPQLGLATGPREHIFAVTQRWLAPDGDRSRGIDGFRLDVPGDIPHPFWIEWRKVVKGANPDAYISGEIWTFAQPWLQGDQFDAVMNYEFAKLAQDFFVDRSTAVGPAELLSRSNQIVNAYSLQVSLVQMNLFDSHDTDRFASMFVNPDRPYDGTNRIQDNGPDYSGAKPDAQQWERFKQAVAFQMTFLGAPMTYYGNEAGMWSPDDPSNRQPMVWEDLKYDDPQVGFNSDIFNHYQRMIAMREHLPELRLGYFRGLVADDARGVAAFARDLGDQTVYVALNRSDKEQAVEFPIGPSDRGAPLLDWCDPNHAQVVTDPVEQGKRPTLRLRPDAQGLSTDGETIKLVLPPFGTAVLSKSR